MGAFAGGRWRPVGRKRARVCKHRESRWRSYNCYPKLAKPVCHFFDCLRPGRGSVVKLQQEQGLPLGAVSRYARLALSDFFRPWNGSVDNRISVPGSEESLVRLRLRRVFASLLRPSTPQGTVTSASSRKRGSMMWIAIHIFVDRAGI